MKYINNLIINTTINNQIKFKAEILVFLIIFNRSKLTNKYFEFINLLKINKNYIVVNTLGNNNSYIPEEIG